MTKRKLGNRSLKKSQSQPIPNTQPISNTFPPTTASPQKKYEFHPARASAASIAAALTQRKRYAEVEYTKRTREQRLSTHKHTAARKLQTLQAYLRSKALERGLQVAGGRTVENVKEDDASYANTNTENGNTESAHLEFAEFAFDNVDAFSKRDNHTSNAKWVDLDLDLRSELNLAGAHDTYGALKRAKTQHQDSCEALCLYYEQFEYKKWKLLLQSGFTLVFYGLGSKKKLMEHFCKTIAKKSPVVICNGYFPGFGVKHILNAITKQLWGETGPAFHFNTLTEHYEYIAARVGLVDHEKRRRGLGRVPTRGPASSRTHASTRANANPLSFYLVLHNMDGESLRTDAAQEMLSKLANCPGIYMMTSVDHLRSRLILDEGLFPHVWLFTPTMVRYSEETSFALPLRRQRGILSVKSALTVLSSLTQNQKTMYFRLLEKKQKGKEKQREKEMAKKAIGYDYFYRLCKNEMLVTTNAEYNAVINLFKEHDLVKEGMGPRGKTLVVPLSNAEITELLDRESECN